MNFLQICQRVFVEGGLSGQISSTQNQSGEALRVVGWVADAYRRLINDQGLNWNFVRPEFIAPLVQGQGTYTFDGLGLPRGVQWDTRSMRVATRPDMADETFLAHMDYRVFRNFWEFSSRRDQTGRPLNATVDADTSLRIAPIPDGEYYIAGQALIDPNALIESVDVPVIPERFHMILVWDALRSYGMFEAAPEVVARADNNLKVILQQLYVDQTPEVTVGGPLC